MEKFDSWSDDFTGVQPFLPLPSGQSPSALPFKVLYGLKWFLLNPIFTLLKLPFLVFCFLSLIFMDSIGRTIFGGNRIFLRVVHFVLAGILLRLLGFWGLDERFVVSKRGNRTPTVSPGSNFGPKHVIITNRCSYIELIYLLYKYSPVFTACPNTCSGPQIPKGKVVEISFLKAFLDTIYQPEYTEEQCQDLKKIVEKSSAPVVVFPEATTTNGKVLLGCVPLFTEHYPNVHILGFRYEHTDFSPVYTVGSFAKHIFLLAGQFYNSLQIRHLIDADIPPWDGEDSWNDKLFNLLASIMAIRRARIMAKEKHPFIQYYYKYQKGYK